MVERVTSSFTATVTVHQLVMLTAVQECYSTLRYLLFHLLHLHLFCSYVPIISFIWWGENVLYNRHGRQLELYKFCIV